MPESPNRLSQLWQELKRRRVIHVITVYASAAFVIIGLVTFNIFAGTRGLRPGDIQSLMILPFDNFTGDDQLDYVASGMHSWRK